MIVPKLGNDYQSDLNLINKSEGEDKIMGNMVEEINRLTEEVNAYRQAEDELSCARESAEMDLDEALEELFNQ